MRPTPSPTRPEDDVDLQVAVMVGDLKAVQKYIKQGGNVNIPDDDGATPLFHAACWNHVEITKDLVSAGAELYVQRNDGFTALHVAAKNNQPKIMKILIQAMNDLSIQEENGDTALHIAYRSRASECIDILLAAGANPQALNHMSKTPRECEGADVDLQDDDGYFDDGYRQSAAASEAPSIDASTVVGVGRDDDRDYQASSASRSPRKPNDGRSAAAGTSPRTNRNRSGARGGDEEGRHGRTGSDPDSRKAQFRVAHPPTIRSGGKWQAMTAYIFEPRAHQAVRRAHVACINGDQQHAFVQSAKDEMEDCDKVLPPGTQVVIRPRFPRAFCVSPVNATIEWMKDAHAVTFELRPPSTLGGGSVSGCFDFYVGPVLIGQAQVEMTVMKPNDGGDNTDQPSIFGPVTKAFDTIYMCFAEDDEPLLLPSLERFKRLGITNIVWGPGGNDERETKKLIRESSIFQICWSVSAKDCNKVKDEIKYATSLAKSGSIAVRGIYWDPSLDVTSIQAAQGLVFLVRLHNSFLLEDPKLFLPGRTTGVASSSPDTMQDLEAATEVEKLCTTAVEHTRGHISRLRSMVDGADIVDVPRVVWIHPDDSDGTPGSIDITTDEWLKKPMRVNFMCPVTMKPGRCGEDGKGYKITFPRGWNSKIGLVLKIGIALIAAASDAGEVADLPAPSIAAVASWAKEGKVARSSAERQEDLVNMVFDGLAGVTPERLNELVDAAFMDAETEGSSAPPVSAQLRKEAKQSYANLRSLVQKYDKGLKMTGLVKVTHEGPAGGPSATEWVHPRVAELFRRKGPALFERGALADADAEAAREAAAQRKAAMTQSKNPFGNAPSAAPSDGRSGLGDKVNGSKVHGGQGQGLEVMNTIRMLENQVLALVQGTGGVVGGA